MYNFRNQLTLQRLNIAKYCFFLTRNPDALEEEQLHAPRKKSLKPPCPEELPPQKYRILLEPALVGAMIAINLGQTSLQNFYLQTACTVDLGIDLEVCEKGEMEVSYKHL